jgi:hypothetical protein
MHLETASVTENSGIRLAVHPLHGKNVDLPEALLSESLWSDEAVEREGLHVVEVPIATIGGGLGSLALVQYLRSAGVPPSNIRILGAVDAPHETYKRLAETSQIGSDDTLRSGSDATMDNIWGWPGYALRQAIGDRSLRPLWTVLTEPVLSEYFNPRSRDFYESVEREARRLEWPTMLTKGQVRMVRRRTSGGYYVVQIPDAGGTPVAYRCTYVHIAAGYPSLRFLPDLQNYRTRYGDSFKVVNAYEPHEHVYQRLRSGPGTVMVRGSGIVASRILQRLFDDRERHGAQTQVLHLFRTYVDGPTGSLLFRRDGGGGFSYQPFNFPKAAFGGQFKAKLEHLNGRDRVELIKAMAGTSTPRRASWQKQIDTGSKHGWYQQYKGAVKEVHPTPNGQISTHLSQSDGTTLEITADFIIDATGLEGEIRDHALLKDVLDHTGAYVNPLGRLDVEPTFELSGTRNNPGRIYASGATTLGGNYGPVDSFVGVQFAALQICDDLARVGFCRRLGPGRSLRQWWRWMRDRSP